MKHTATLIDLPGLRTMYSLGWPVYNPYTRSVRCTVFSTLDLSLDQMLKRNKKKIIIVNVVYTDYKPNARS